MVALVAVSPLLVRIPAKPAAIGRQDGHGLSAFGHGGAIERCLGGHSTDILEQFLLLASAEGFRVIKEPRFYLHFLHGIITVNWLEKGNRPLA